MSGSAYLSLAVLISFLSGAFTKIYYITPNSSDLCPTQCLTISELAANTSNYVSSNTTLIFNTVTHTLTANVTVSDVNNVSIVTLNGSSAQIVCVYPSYITFNDSLFIHVSNVEFLGCGGINVLNVKEFVLQNAVFDGQDKIETSLWLTESNGEILNSSFISNIQGNLDEYKPINITYSKILKLIKQTSLIANSYTVTAPRGVVVVMDSNITFSQCTFQNNQVSVGGVMLVMKSQVTIDRSTFINNKGRGHPWQCEGTFCFGKVVYLQGSRVVITNSYFRNNSAYLGGVILSLSMSLSLLNVENTSFSGNTAGVGGVL